MTEQVKPWAGMGYEPVGPIVNKLLARYLRTQRKNMRRLFQERGLYTLADRMDQIRNSRQGMLAKNQMFQEVLSLYASQNMPTPAQVPEQVESVHGVRPDSFQVLEESESREGVLSLDGVAESEPGKATGDPEQTLQVPNPDQADTENL
jgi:hypothetical protein